MMQSNGLGELPFALSLFVSRFISLPRARTLSLCNASLLKSQKIGWSLPVYLYACFNTQKHTLSRALSLSHTHTNTHTHTHLMDEPCAPLRLLCFRGPQVPR
jgi:hypothetical protein